MRPKSPRRRRSATRTKPANARGWLRANWASTCTACVRPWRRPGSSMSTIPRMSEEKWSGPMDRLKLKAVLGSHPHVQAVRSGELRSDPFDLDFIAYPPTNPAFKPMVREQAFDVCEMAIVTYLMAKAHGKPLVLLPATMLGRFQHSYALYSSAQGTLGPSDLEGKRVGIRSFTTTTGAWIRGILANDYGVDLDSVEWITFEEPHVAEYKDTTQRAPEGKKIVPMLLDGELDAVLGESSGDRRIKSLLGILRTKRSGGTPSTRWCRSTISWSCVRTTSQRTRTVHARSIGCCGRASGWQARHQLQTRFRSVSKPTGRASR